MPRMILGLPWPQTGVVPMHCHGSADQDRSLDRGRGGDWVALFRSSLQMWGATAAAELAQACSDVDIRPLEMSFGLLHHVELCTKIMGGRRAQKKIGQLVCRQNLLLVVRCSVDPV